MQPTSQPASMLHVAHFLYQHFSRLFAESHRKARLENQPTGNVAVKVQAHALLLLFFFSFLLLQKW